MPTQTAWNTAAIPYATVKLCGCDENIVTGQKLYRVVNYMSALTGNGTITVPPPFPLPGTPTEVFLYVLEDIHGTPYEVDIQDELSSSGYWAIIQLGLGLGNPYWFHGPTDTIIKFFPGDPFFNQLAATANNKLYELCTWDANYAPLGVGQIWANPP